MTQTDTLLTLLTLSTYSSLCKWWKTSFPWWSRTRWLRHIRCRPKLKTLRKSSSSSTWSPITRWWWWWWWWWWWSFFSSSFCTLCCPSGNFPMGNVGHFPQGKLAAAESLYPTLIVNYIVEAGSFRAVIHRTLTCSTGSWKCVRDHSWTTGVLTCGRDHSWTTGSLTCVRHHSWSCVYTRG